MKALTRIDINCDLGEGINEFDYEKDQRLMQYISSCNIACGGHAGNALTMNRSLANAKAAAINIGAHPGYPDKTNFGRVSMSITVDKLKESLYSQIQTLLAHAEKIQAQITYIKFHGALYNDIESDDGLAEELVKFCQQHFPSMSLLGLAEGQLKKFCQHFGVQFIAEGFMDRRYLANSKLSSRSLENSVISDKQIAIEQAIALSLGRPFLTLDNSSLTLSVDSICLHGDNPNAEETAKALVKSLESHGIVIARGQN